MEDKITGIILAGGKSSRMYKNKALLEIKGIKLIEYVYNALLPITDSVLISSNTNEFDFLNAEIVKDIYKDIGPAGGIYSSLTKSKTEKNLIVSCDTPLLTTSFFSFMIERSQNFDVAIPRIGDFSEPIIGVYKKNVALNFKEAIENKIYSPHVILKTLKVNIVSISQNSAFYHPLMFKSINTEANFREVVSEFK